MTTKKPQDKPLNANANKLPQRQAAEYCSAYSNQAEIGTSSWDFRFLFFEITEDETGELIREKKARVVMSPQHAMAFAQVLNHTIERWRKEHASDARNTPAQKLDA